MSTTADKLAALRAALNSDKIPFRDIDFCTSIVEAAERGRASEKQLHWLGVLYDRHCGAPAPELDLSRLFALLTAAKAHLKRPFILVASPLGDLRLTLSRDGQGVHVTCKALTPDYLGTVRNGRLFPNGQAIGLDVPALTAALAVMAADPAAAAAAYGHAKGTCCFCARDLTDGRSVAVGYGPICAEHYGLPWGDVTANPVAYTAGGTLQLNLGEMRE